MAGSDFSFDGLAGVIARMTAFERRVLDAADEAVLEVAAEMTGLVREAAPVDIGRLRASVRHSKRGWAFALVEAGAGIDHAKPQEARTKFFNRSISVGQQGLAARVVQKIQEKAF